MPEATAKPNTPNRSLYERWEAELGVSREFPTQLEIPLRASPVGWLQSQSDLFQLLWANRGAQEPIVAAGTAMHITGQPGESADSVIQRCRDILAGNAELRFFGGFPFAAGQPLRSPEWQPFGTAQFWLPRWIFDGKRLQLTVLSRADIPAALSAVTMLRSAEPIPAWTCPRGWQRTDLPDRKQWFANVEKALGLFRDEILEKVVLARRATFRFEAPLCPLGLADRLSIGTASCYRFCLRLGPETAFLGATPERLFLRRGTTLESEVVAGTRRRGQTSAEDEALATELRNSAKEQREHDIVRKCIRQRLHACVHSLQVDERASVLKLPRKQHLYSRVYGQLRCGVTDGELLERLHPTPAVGGYPTDLALSEIEQLEPFERGWYAAPIGWIGADAAEFAVAIRSGLLHGHQLSLYSGAGIVPGSTAELEWDEIEHKIADFLEIIQVASAPQPRMNSETWNDA